MDVTSIILISTFCSFTSIGICCVLVKAFHHSNQESARQRMRESIRRARDRLRYTLLVVPEEHTEEHTEEITEELKDENENLRHPELLEIV